MSAPTTECRAWRVVREDGVTLGFTDHDCDLVWDGVTFRAGSGLTAGSLQQSTGLAVDNTEALGVLTASAVTEADIHAGLYDGAEVTAWQLDWTDVAQRRLVFRGSIGEIRQGRGGFAVDLRGLTEALGQPGGRVFQRGCPAVLGGKGCKFDLNRPGYWAETKVLSVTGQTLGLPALADYADGWFERGVLRLNGRAVLIKRDLRTEVGREVIIWEDLPVQVGDLVRLEAGCDKRAETCRLKFNNLLNFQGFPNIPGEDWLMSVPSRKGLNDGGAL